jgi:hypothetical protein
MTEIWPRHLLQVPTALIPHPSFTLPSTTPDPAAIREVQRFRRVGELGVWSIPSQATRGHAAPPIQLNGKAEEVAYTVYIAVQEMANYRDGQTMSLDHPLQLLHGLMQDPYGYIHGILPQDFVQRLAVGIQMERDITEFVAWWYRSTLDPDSAEILHQDPAQDAAGGWSRLQGALGTAARRTAANLMQCPLADSLFNRARAKTVAIAQQMEKCSAVFGERHRKLLADLQFMVETAASMHLCYNRSLDDSLQPAKAVEFLRKCLASLRQLTREYPEHGTLKAWLQFQLRHVPPLPKWLADYAAHIEQANRVGYRAVPL